jgi:SAM-dependent methyltransferase
VQIGNFTTGITKLRVAMRRNIDMTENINNRAYWDNIFLSGGREEKRRKYQTENFARAQIQHLKIGNNFKGTLLEFGCGSGDAMPVHKENYPQAKLVGIDFSQAAIDKCREKYGSIAFFVHGDYDSVPNVDIIIASNVFEHLTDDHNIAKRFLCKCKQLYIIVPYMEFPLIPEHVNSYDEHYFSGVGKYEYKVFHCVGWSSGLRELWYRIFFKNIFRFIFKKPLHHRKMQIIYSFTNPIDATVA